jgi:hypothetical protein
MYTVLTERLEELSPCLEVLVPMLQQAWVDFLADPTPVGDKLIEIADTYNNYWKLSEGLNARAFELFESEGIGGNGPDSTYGNFDAERIQALFDELIPVMETLGIDPLEGITADQVFTNEFIDESIGVPG